VVDFRDNAWVENVMLRWLQHQWQVAIDHPGQYTLRNTKKTQAVKDVMPRMHTLPVMIPAGCTSLVQPLDVCLNKPFKDRIRALAD